MSPLLQAESITVRFGGVVANTDVDLDAYAGQVTGLIGPNGAGKTTMFNVLSGLNSPNEGTVLFDGQDITSFTPFKRARLGMARTFQRLEVFGSLTAYENVLVGAEIRKSFSPNAPAPPDQADELIERIGLVDVRDERVDSLSTGHARLVELARALVGEPRMILLDEPSSGLDDSETEFFGDILLEIAETGVGMLMVEHDVPLVMRVCELIHVLEFGQIIARGDAEDIQNNAKVQAAYLGEGDDEDAA